MATGNTRRWLSAFICAASCVSITPVVAGQSETPAVADPGEPVDLLAEEPAAAPEEEAQALPVGQTVNVGSFGEIDLHVKDLNLTKVLQLLSIQSQRNIIASKNVAGTVSADLYGVDFYQALDAILHANGFGYVEKGQFIYVYTAQELQEIEKAQRKLTSEIVRLNYISAADASTFVQPLLSEAGSIAVSGDASKGFQPNLGDAGANTFAHADTLVIRDYRENIDEIMSVLEELDIRPKQVLVEATVLQARLTESNAFGVDLNVLIDTSFENLVGAPTDVVDSMIEGDVAGSGTPLNATIGDAGGIQSGVGNTAAAGGFKVGVITEHVSAFVRALDSVTDTTVLANPKLLVLNRQKADLLVGGRLGYLSSTATETATTQTVEFLDVGTQLTVRPFVSDDEFIRLELRPELSDGETVNVDGFIIPNETTQTLTTNVIVQSGQTVVLGGLFKEDVTVGRRQVPGLGSVPIVGAAFRGQDDTVERNEVIFLIKPSIVQNEALYAMGDALRDNTQMAVLGARKGLLPWSRTKLTSAYMRDANQYLDQGDEERALWAANKALYVDPTLTDALELKQDITGDQIYYHDFSILNEAVDSSIESHI